MLLQDGYFEGYDSLGDLGWGFRSIGRGFKKVGKGAYKAGKGVAKGAYATGKIGFKVAALPARAALKVANATQSLLCKGAAGTAASLTPTGTAFCKAMALKNTIAMRKLLPAAVTEAAATAARAKALARVNATQLDPEAVASAALIAALQNPGTRVSSIGEAPSALWRQASAAKKMGFKACVRAQMREMDMARGDAEYSCADELRGLSGDVDLLASLDGVDPDDLAFALAAVDPGEIGAALTRADAVAMLPIGIAVLAGFWMLTRG